MSTESNEIQITTPNGIIIPHGDHGLTEEHLKVIDVELADWKGELMMKVITLPEGCPDVPSALYGPSVGDDPVTEDKVKYESRNGRPGKSRLIDLPHRPARNIAMLGARTELGLMLFTAYGTQSDRLSEREWWDNSMLPHEALVAAKFWCDHALAV